jgi:hypothetical protein
MYPERQYNPTEWLETYKTTKQQTLWQQSSLLSS